SNLSHKFTYESDGVHFINETLKQKKGGILISAHVGNFEISEYFFGELEENASISLLTTDIEHTAIKEYLDSVRKKSNIKLIIIRHDIIQIFGINAELDRNESVCITGVRYIIASKLFTD